MTRLVQPFARAETLRTADDLVAAGLARDVSELAAVTAAYATAITPAMAALIDRADPADPIARQFVPSARRARRPPRRAARSDRRQDARAGRRDRPSLSGPRAAQGRIRVPGLLPLLLPPRDGGAGQRRQSFTGRTRSCARLHPRASRNLGSHHHRRRSLHAVRPTRVGADARA